MTRFKYGWCQSTTTLATFNTEVIESMGRCTPGTYAPAGQIHRPALDLSK